MPPARVLRVVAQPYAHLDGDGHAACAIPMPGNPERYIGAIARPVRKLPREGFGGEGKGELGKLLFDFSTDAVEIPYDAGADFFVRALAAGELLPADEFTARIAGVEFRPIETAIADAKKAAIDEWKRHGRWFDPACATDQGKPVAPGDAPKTDTLPGGLKALHAGTTAADPADEVR